MTYWWVKNFLSWIWWRSKRLISTLRHQIIG